MPSADRYTNASVSSAPPQITLWLKPASTHLYLQFMTNILFPPDPDHSTNACADLSLHQHSQSLADRVKQDNRYNCFNRQETIPSEWLQHKGFCLLVARFWLWRWRRITAAKGTKLCWLKGGGPSAFFILRKQLISISLTPQISRLLLVRVFFCITKWKDCQNKGGVGLCLFSLSFNIPCPLLRSIPVAELDF